MAAGACCQRISRPYRSRSRRPYGHAHGLRQLAGTFPGLTAKQQATIKALNAEYAKLEAEYEHANELAADVDELLPGGGYGRSYCRIFDEVGHETQRYQNDRVVLQ
ncbi:hypothetical protein [Mesorhizobium sp. LjNodule214]|uniref:hypothetical protein n=1 Tax=Mesorhizobium sp. LjNodule214 TaxID=3342252 RepID=UPI003ECD95DF